MSDREIADWIAETCLKFGAATSTAYQVAGLFIEQLELDRRRVAIHSSTTEGE